MNLWLHCLLTVAALILQCTSADHDFEETIERRKRGADQYIPPPSPWKGTDWNRMGRKSIIQNREKFRRLVKKRAKNVIMFLGDGMGVTTTSVARLFKREEGELKNLEEMYLKWETFPFSSLVRTYNIDRTTSDSAGTATAYLSGVKANLGTIGLNENVYFTKCYNVKNSKVESILHKSIKAGKSTGVVTTTRITHASPAGTYASTPHRKWEAGVPEKENPAKECSDIASQLIYDPRNSGINVLFGGGAANFLPNTTTDEATGKPGKRVDGQDLLKAWRKKKLQECGDEDRVTLVRDKKSFDAIDVEKSDYTMGLFSDGHLNFELERDSTKQPSLEEMTKKAIQLLQKNDKGFFLFVEGGRIDSAHHENKAKKALSEVLALEKAVESALSMVNLDETLVLVTADHSHLFTFGGYALFQESVLGLAEKRGIPAMDGKPYQQIFYANGPGQMKHRVQMTSATTFNEVPRKNLTGNQDIYTDDFQQDTGVFTMDEGHGGEDVAVYAAGPWSHLFQGTEEQSYIAHVMMFASCVGDYANDAHCGTDAKKK